MLSGSENYTEESRHYSGRREIVKDSGFPDPAPGLSAAGFGKAQFYLFGETGMPSALLQCPETVGTRVANIGLHQQPIGRVVEPSPPEYTVRAMFTAFRTGHNVLARGRSFQPSRNTAVWASRFGITAILEEPDRK